MLGAVALSDDLGRIAAAAARFRGPGEELAGVVAAEPGNSARVYVCAFRGEDDTVAWLAFDETGAPVAARAVVREAVSIVALCELAEEIAGGGDLDELRSQLVALRVTENPPGIEDAERALDELARTIGAPPSVATPARLDAVGAATRRLEEALGEGGASPFAEAMKQAFGTVDELARDVEANYKLELS